MHSFEFVKDYFIEEDSFFVKKMFGGESLCFKDKMVLVLMDSNSTVWKNKNYKEKIWFGILIPTEKEYHSQLIKKNPELRVHPVLRKWLFLSADTINFEEVAKNLCEDILNNSKEIGILLKY